MHAKYRNFAFFTLLMVVVLVIFETFQQYYYLLQFDIVPREQFTFGELMVSQAYRWMVWMILSLAYFGTIIYKGRSERLFNISGIGTAALHLLILIIINVCLVASLQLIINGLPFSLNSFWDNCVFYFFQKSPIYTLGHGAMLGLFHLVSANQNLAIEILDLKQDKDEVSETPQALSIKIGTRNKIIPVDDIVWIEAYDYCVKIHTVQQHAYAMRNSLKALEKKLLDQQFLRVHRKAIVNMNKVSEVTYNSSSYLTLQDQTKIDIAQSRVKNIKTFFG